jgi:threonine synthase
MRFCSTRDTKLSLSLAQALFTPKLADGGLFMPKDDLNLRQYLYIMDEATSFKELVRILAMEIFKDDMTPALMRRIQATAADLSPRIRTLDESITFLELFHGPTSAFQDYSMAFLADLMSELKPAGKKIRLLIPTSGDTGAAAAHAFSDEADFDIVLLCPKASIPELNRNHLSRFGGNTHMVAVEGSFQDCLALTNQAFGDPRLSGDYSLASATTRNPGRLLSQVFHYFYGFIHMKKEAGDFYFDIPSGNYGNFSSGMLAWKWGLPVTGFISASRGSEKALPELLAVKNGTEAMKIFADVSNPENFERISFLSAGSPAVMRSMIRSEYVSEAQIKETIRQVHEEFDMFLDPFTAMGYAAARRVQRASLEETGKIILLATGHPWKYADLVEEACGHRPSSPTSFERDKGMGAEKKPDATIKPQLAELERYLAGC